MLLAPYRLGVQAYSSLEEWVYHGPAFFVEMHLAQEHFCLPVVRFFVGMAEEVPLPAQLISGVMSCSKEFVVRTDERIAAAFLHRLAFFVYIWTRYILASAHYGAVSASLASAAVVEADKKVVVLAVLDDEGGLDGIVSGFDSVIAFYGVVLDVVDFGSTLRTP